MQWLAWRRNGDQQLFVNLKLFIYFSERSVVRKIAILVAQNPIMDLQTLAFKTN